MTSIPSHFRHIDWITYGLYWMESLRSDIAASVSPGPSRPRSTSAFGMLDHPNQHLAWSLQDLMQSVTDVDTLLDVHKQFSAGLRYAYLRSIHVRNVYFSSKTPPFRSVFELADDTSFLLFPYADHELPDTPFVLLQGPEVDRWYDLSRWAQHAPIQPVFSESAPYPLSVPRCCDSRFDALLTTIGASPSGQSGWRPPPATSTEDMYRYVHGHPSNTPRYQRGVETER